MNAPWRTILLTLVLDLTTVGLVGAVTPMVSVGVAKVDITPELPIRLSGYQSRAKPAERVEARLHARALAIGADEQQPVVLVAAEVIGIGEETSEAVAAALQERFGIDRARVAVCATHTHTGPALADVLPYMFSRELPAEERDAIARYTATLRERLIAVAAAALAARKPARLAWSEGRVGFATHRRVIADGKWKGFGMVPGGPVDHALPVLRVTDELGTVRAVLLSYACHCTTLGGGDNFVHPDWAGDAAARIEGSLGGAPALVAIGCGADANPGLQRGLEGVGVHGEKVAAEVARLLGEPMRELGPVTTAEFRRLRLPLDHAVSRDELQQRTGKGARPAAAYAAGRFLRELDAGRALPEAVPYPVQAWSFGRELAMVFLGGEVVSEYSLRLRREIPGGRLWVNAYANSVPCYVPSARMYPEGGYEVDNSMDYYGWPTRLARGTEDLIVGAVRELVPAEIGAGNRR
jgi:hypothetical protein